MHRDVKSANVLVSHDGLVKVADFGIATAAAMPTLTGGGVLLGTAAYLSPEQAQGGLVDARSDVYALGCVLYELLCGAPPFVADSPLAVLAQQIAEVPTPPSRRDPQVGPELEAVVMTALEKQPGRRYQTASAMGQELERVVGGGAAGAVAPWLAAAGPAAGPLGTRATSPASAPTVVVAGRAVRGAARRPGWARWPLAAGVGLVVVLVVALWWWRGGGAAIVAGPAGPAPMTTSIPTATTASTPTAMPTPRSQPSLSAALATLRGVIVAGERQGMVDPDAEDLLHQAREVVRVVREGDGDEVGKQLEELGRKVDELIGEGKIAPAAAGGVRQAVAQLGRAVERAAGSSGQSGSEG